MNSIDGYKLMSIMRHTLNAIDARLIDHGYRVAYMVYKIASDDATLKPSEIRDITITAFLHDIGAYKTDDIDNMIEFETQNMMKHSIYGYLFLKYLAPLEEYAHFVLCHHISYDELINYQVPQWKWIQILSICDRFDVLISSNKTIDEAYEILKAYSGTLFSSELLDVFFSIDKKYNITYDVYHKHELDFDIAVHTPHSKKELRAYLDMITYSIDFRSQYMVTHTMTTNRISMILGRLMKISTNNLEKIDLGSILHDLGKIAIPIEILDFPGKLDDEQMEYMRKHVEYTAIILNHNLLDEEVINIAIRHHEKLNGKGYPLGLSEKDLSINERIVAIADIISALYEQRSYKGALQKDDIIHILRMNVEDGGLDSTIVDKAIENYDSIMDEVQKECNPMIETYHTMSELYPIISKDYKAYIHKIFSDK